MFLTTPPPFFQVLDPQSGELSHVFVHATCASKRVATAGAGGRDGGQRSSSSASAAGGEPLMSKIQRQLLLQVTRALSADRLVLTRLQRMADQLRLQVSVSRSAKPLIVNSLAD